MSVLNKYLKECKEGGHEPSFLISTDLETDDVLAIYLLAKHIKDHKVTFLVGEGDSFFKDIRIKSYAKSFGFTKCDFIQGYSTKNVFKYDAHDVLTDEDDIDSMMVLIENVDLVKKKLFNLLKSGPVFIISLKPFRELIEMFYKPISGQEINDHIKNCVFSGYMSFNVRCLMRDWEKPKIVEFLKGFRSCLFYTTRNAVGSGNNNIITEKDFNFKFLPEVVSKVMLLWNKHQLEYSQNIVRNLEGSKLEKDIKRVKRNKKTIRQVYDNDFKQFVNADTGLALSLIEDNPPYIRKNIRYIEKTGYSVVEDGNDMLVYLPKDKKECRMKQVAMMFLWGDTMISS